MLSTSQQHFLRNKLCSCRRSRTSCVASLWSCSEVDVAMRISSMKTMILTPLFAHLSLSCQKMWFIIFWKVAGELQRPKYMTIGSYKPYLVLNAALCWSPSLMRTLLKPPSTSNFEKTNASYTSTINSGMSGSGYLLQIVHLLTPL